MRRVSPLVFTVRPGLLEELFREHIAQIRCRLYYRLGMRAVHMQGLVVTHSQEVGMMLELPSLDAVVERRQDVRVCFQPRRGVRRVPDARAVAEHAHTGMARVNRRNVCHKLLS